MIKLPKLLNNDLVDMSGGRIRRPLTEDQLAMNLLILAVEEIQHHLDQLTPQEKRDDAKDSN